MKFYEIIKECKSIRESFSGSYEFDPIQGMDPVIGEGMIDSKIMIIARDLGREEVTKGRPLIGEAGQIVRQVLLYLGIGSNVYMTNLVPYKPFNNTVFSPTIRKAFVPILTEQIKIIQPKCIITLGKESAEEIIGMTGSVLSGIKNYYLNSSCFLVENILNSNVNCNIFPAVHPSFILRKGINKNNVAYGIKNKNELFMNYFFNSFKMAKMSI
jgi:uracil-DNA glycosylase family 4